MLHAIGLEGEGGGRVQAMCGRKTLRKSRGNCAICAIPEAVIIDAETESLGGTKELSTPLGLRTADTPP